MPPPHVYKTLWVRTRTRTHGKRRSFSAGTDLLAAGESQVRARALTHTYTLRRNTRCRPEHLALLNGRRRRLERSTASCTPRRTGGLRLLRRAGLPCWLPVRERRHSARPHWHHDLRPPPPEGNGRGDTRGVTPENTPKLFSGGEPTGFCLDKYCANPGA